MTNQSAPDPLQQLQLIDSMINKARNRFSQNGHLYLLWGWTVLICSVTHYLLQFVFGVRYSWMVWFACWIVMIYQVFYLRKYRKKRTVVTYTEELVSFVWLTFIILYGLLMLVILPFAKSPHNADAVLLVLYGMPTFLSGIILKFRPLIVGAASCWTLALASLLIPLQYHMLLIAAAVIPAWIIPGYLLQRRFKLQNLQ